MSISCALSWKVSSEVVSARRIVRQGSTRCSQAFHLLQFFAPSFDVELPEVYNNANASLLRNYTVITNLPMHIAMVVFVFKN